MEKTLHQVSSLAETHAFSGLPLDFGFIGKENQAELQEKKLHHAKQVHGTHLVQASSQTEASCRGGSRPEADALYSLEKGTVVSVRTADCLPILLTDHEVSFVMVLHAGWRGLAAGIIPKSLEALAQKIPLNKGNLRVFLGPCIEIEAFEVGPEVIETFAKGSGGLLEESSFVKCHSKGSGDRSYFSLKQYAFASLLALGVGESFISSLHSCTYHNQEKWFSFRREGTPLRGYDWSWITRL